MIERGAAFWCENCSKYRLRADTRISLDATFLLAVRGNQLKASADGTVFTVLGHRELCDPERDFACWYCGESAELRTFPIDECPHAWYRQYGTVNRECRLCGREERGRVVFED